MGPRFIMTHRNWGCIPYLCNTFLHLDDQTGQCHFKNAFNRFILPHI